MKILILNGSPRPGGDTAALIARLRQRLEAEYVQVDAYRADIGPCVDCRRCWREPGCILSDGMEALWEHIRSCDAVVVASPVYFSLLTGPLLSLASRLQANYIARRELGLDLAGREKPGAVLLAGGGDGSAEKALEAARCMLRLMNGRYAGHAASLCTDRLPAARDEAALAAVDALAARLGALMQGREADA